MKLDRNITSPRRGKYALIKLRIPDAFGRWDDGYQEVKDEAIDYGNTPDTDFFVIRLKDKYAAKALFAYAEAALDDGETEYGFEIIQLANLAKAGENRKPD